MRTNQPDLNVEILGVNRADRSAYSQYITTGRTLPWLQDTTEQAVWSRWQAVEGDVRILDSQNHLYAVFNVGTQDLSLAQNREALKQLFLQVAKAVDADGNQLPDAWEQQVVLNLPAKASEDPDGDGRDNFTEFAFGTSPVNAQSSVPIRTSVVTAGEQSFLSVVFRRRAGSILDYFVEVSSDIQSWTGVTAADSEIPPLRNLFDGTGTVEASYRLKQATSDQPRRFLRVRAVPRPRP